MDEFLKVIFPHKGYIVTPVLIYVSCLVFAAMMFFGFGFLNFDAESLVTWGANSRELVASGEWWRLFSYQFLHSDVIHILGNMTSLFLAGLILESHIGSGRLLLAYLVSGVVAGLASIGWYADTPSVGASGAIFGLYGLALALIQNKAFPSDWMYVFLIMTASMVGYGFLIGLFGNIDNAAHVGGMIAGYIFGLVYTSAVRKRMMAKEQALARQSG